MLNKYEDQLWICKACRPEVRNFTEKVTKLKKKNEVLLEEIKEMREAMKEMVKEEMERANQKAKEIAREEIGMETRNSFAALKDEVVTNIKEEMVEIIKEEEDKHRRRKNLVLYNVPESRRPNPSGRKQEDEDFCQALFTETLEVPREEFKIKKAIRLGKNRYEGRNRPVLVKFEEESEKWNTLKNVRKLRGETDEVKRKIGISQDLTMRQREQERCLRQELMEKRERGETGWYIKKRKTVQSQRGRKQRILSNTQNKQENDKDKDNRKPTHREQKTFSVKLINIQGLSNTKVVEVEHLLKDKGDLLCITETQNTTNSTKFTDNIIRHISMRTAKDKKGGGLMTCYREGKEIDFKQTNIDKNTKDFMEIRGKIWNFDMVIILLYFSVETKEEDRQRNQKMKKEVERRIETVEEEEALIVLGDFNGHIGMLGYHTSEQ